MDCLGNYYRLMRDKVENQDICRQQAGKQENKEKYA